MRSHLRALPHRPDAAFRVRRWAGEGNWSDAANDGARFPQWLGGTGRDVTALIEGVPGTWRKARCARCLMRLSRRRPDGRLRLRMLPAGPSRPRWRCGLSASRRRSSTSRASCPVLGGGQVVTFLGGALCRPRRLEQALPALQPDDVAGLRPVTPRVMRLSRIGGRTSPMPMSLPASRPSSSGWSSSGCSASTTLHLRVSSASVSGWRGGLNLLELPVFGSQGDRCGGGLGEQHMGHGRWLLAAAPGGMSPAPRRIHRSVTPIGTLPELLRHCNGFLTGSLPWLFHDRPHLVQVATPRPLLGAAAPATRWRSRGPSGRD